MSEFFVFEFKISSQQKATNILGKTWYKTWQGKKRLLVFCDVFILNNVCYLIVFVKIKFLT